MNIRSLEVRLRRLEKLGGGGGFDAWTRGMKLETMRAICLANAVEAKAMLEGRDPGDSWDEQVGVVMDALECTADEATALLIKRDSFNDFPKEEAEVLRMSHEDAEAWHYEILQEIAAAEYLEA